MNHHHSGLLAVVVFALLGFGSGAFAGEISGEVRDAATGRRLANATVRIPELNRSVVADRSGSYRITDLPAGNYTVEARFVGFENQISTVTVPESGTVVQPLAMTAAAMATDEITVIGFRLQQAQSLQSKKAASVIKDTVTADDAGKLPDQNAAEALARLPGLSITNDQGEGRYVTVRGVDPSLNNVTLDGQIIGAPEADTRSVSLDTVPANLLSRLEVVKSVTPDMDANAIGGSINIITPSAFDDPDGRFISITGEYGYYDLGEENPFGAAVAYGQTFGADDQWGIVLSASYSDREYTSENLQGGDPWEEEGDFLVPDEFVLRDYSIERERTGFVANLDFRPNDNMQFYFRNLYNEFKDTELQPETVFDYRNGDLTDQTPTSGTFSEGEASREVQAREETQSILSSTLGAVLRSGDWTFEPSLTFGNAEQDTPSDIGWVFEYEDVAPMTYDTSRRLFNVEAPDEVYDDTLFSFEEHFRGGQQVEEDLAIGMFDVQRDFLGGENPGFIKIGAKYLDREKTSDQNITVYDGLDDLDLLLSDVSIPGRPDFYSSEGGRRFGPKVNATAANRFFAENQAAFEVNDADTIAESFGVDFTVKEEITAGYFMGSVDVGRATIVGGIRVEHTSADFDAFDIQFVDGEIEGEPTPVTGSKSYTNWLPGIQTRVAVQDNLIFRAAWTNTIGRPPSFETNAPFRIFDTEEIDPDNDPGVFEGTIEAGNPDLDALESANFDLALEWYTESGGVMSVGLFYKDVDNPIYETVNVLEEEEFEGRFYEELEFVQPQNAVSGEIAGIELNLQQQFRMLPSPFDGLGVAVTYTYSDAEAEGFGRNDLPFFRQSDHVGNAALFYERSGFELRLAYSYRSEYLEAIVFDDPSQDLYVDTHGQLDLKTSYAFTDYLTAFLSFQNLTDEPLRYYSGDESRVAENEIYGWNAMAGVQLQF